MPRGRPPKKKPKTASFNIRVDEEFFDRFNSLSERVGRAPSDLARRAMEQKATEIERGQHEEGFVWMRVTLDEQLATVQWREITRRFPGPLVRAFVQLGAWSLEASSVRDVVVALARAIEEGQEA